MRTKKAILNILTSLIYQILLIISGLIVPKLILETYGSACNGVVSSAVQFMSVISLLTIGLTGATRVELYKSLGKNEKEKTSDIMYSTNKYLHKVAYILILYTIILAIVYPYISNTDLSNRFVFAIIVTVGIGKFFEYFLGLPYRILLQADQKNYIEQSVMIFGCIIYTILSYLMIKKGSSLVTVKLMNAGVSFVGMCILCIYARHTYELKGKMIGKIVELPQRKAAAMHSIANLVHQNSALVILTFFSDVKMISVYSVYYYVIGQIKNIMSAFSGGLEAAFGNMWVKGEYENLKRRFCFYEYLIYSVVIIIFSCVWNLIIPFISLYTENVTDTNYILPIFAVLVSIAEIIYCIRQPYTTLIYATGKYKETQQIAVIEALVNIVISISLVIKVGLYGVAIGTLVANMVRTLFYIWYTSKVIIRRKFKEIFYRISYFCVTFLVCVYAENLVLGFMDINKWENWILGGIIAVVFSIFVVLIMSLFMERRMFREVWELFRLIKKR